MAPFAGLPPELSFAILARLTPLPRNLRATSSEARAAVAQLVTSLEWIADTPPPVVDLSASFPAALSLKLHTEWRSEEDGVRWLRANQRLLARLHALELNFNVSNSDGPCSRLDEATLSAAARCTALRSLSLDTYFCDDDSPHQELTALTNLTSLHLRLTVPYRQLVETLRQLPRLQHLHLELEVMLEADLALTSRLASLTYLGMGFIDESDGVDLAALAAATGLRHLVIGMGTVAEAHVQGLARLTQLSSLRLPVCGRLDPAPLSALTTLTRLELPARELDAAATAALAGMLRNLATLECGQLGGGRVDPELLHTMSCTSLDISRGLVMDCSLLSPDRPPLPRLQSLQLRRSLSSCPLVLHLSSLTSLSIGDYSNDRLSDTDCRQLAQRLPLLRALHLGWRTGLASSAVQPLTLDGLKQLGRLQHLQQLCLAPVELPLLAYPVLARQCSALQRLLLSCSQDSKLEGSSLEACLASLAGTRLRHVVLLAWERDAWEGLQEVCDRVVGAWGRQELVMEARRWGLEKAWQYMLEQASA
jgi:hypothetical protein